MLSDDSDSLLQLTLWSWTRGHLSRQMKGRPSCSESHCLLPAIMGTVRFCSIKRWVGGLQLWPHASFLNSSRHDWQDSSPSSSLIKEPVCFQLFPSCPFAVLSGNYSPRGPASSSAGEKNVSAKTSLTASNFLMAKWRTKNCFHYSLLYGIRITLQGLALSLCNERINNPLFKWLLLKTASWLTPSISLATLSGYMEFTYVFLCLPNELKVSKDLLATTYINCPCYSNSDKWYPEGKPHFLMKPACLVIGRLPVTEWKKKCVCVHASLALHICIHTYLHIHIHVCIYIVCFS